MLNIIKLVITALITGLFLAIPSVLIEKWLVKKGFARDQTLSVCIISISLVFVKLYWFTSISWPYLYFFIFVATIFGANRADFWTTVQKGRWWWNEEKKKL